MQAVEAVPAAGALAIEPAMYLQDVEGEIQALVGGILGVNVGQQPAIHGGKLLAADSHKLNPPQCKHEFCVFGNECMPWGSRILLQLFMECALLNLSQR